MRSARAIRKRIRRKKDSALEVDITSLLDILVILLIFLLKSYNSSGVVFNVEKDIELPKSSSQSINTAGIIVQVSPTKIMVDGEVVLDSSDQPPVVYGKGRRRILPLFDSLVRKREEVNSLAKTVPNAKPFSGIINFVIDKTLGYYYVKKLMYTAAEAGYFKFNFVVLGEES